MPAANYEFMLDLNHDGFFARGVQASDAPNLLRQAVNGGFYYQRFANATVSHAYQINSLDRSRYIFTVVTGTSANAGIGIGNTVSPGRTVYLVAGSLYRARAVVQGTAGESLQMRFNPAAGGTAGTVLLDGTEQTVECSITPGSSGNFSISILRITTTTNITFYVHDLIMTRDAALPTEFNSGAGSDAYENVTTWVRQAQWNNGLSAPYDTVADETKLTLTLDNAEDRFNQERLIGAQLLANNEFATWSAGSPTSWTVALALFNAIEEVGTGELSGGTGTGAINFNGGTGGFGFTTLTQTILTIGSRYKVTLFVSAQSTGNLQFKCGDAFIAQRYTTPDYYEFAFTATATTFTICIDANDGDDTDITLDYVTVQEVRRYYGMTKGMLVGVWIDDAQMWVGRILNIQQTWGALVDEAVTITCGDAMSSLMSADLKPTFALTTSVGLALEDMFDNTGFCFPYESSYWVLGIDGQSELGETTILADPSDYLLDGNLGDDFIYGDKASNNSSGVSARAYIGDVMESSMGGKFYWNGRQNHFIALDRHYDYANITDIYSLTDDDYESMDYRFGDDLLNQVTIRYTAREQESDTKTLWSLLAPFTIQPDETKKINAEFRDPGQVEIKVYAYQLTPFDNTDFTASLVHTELMVITRKDFSQSCTFSLTNTGTKPVTVSALRVRGKIIRSAQEESVTMENAQSIRQNERYPRTYSLPLIIEPEDAQNYAISLISQFGNAFGRYESITFIANKTPERLSRISVVSIGIRIQITDAHNGHSAAYILVGERHAMQAGGENTHTVTWILKPVDRITYWILGVTGRSELSQTTYLAF